MITLLIIFGVIMLIEFIYILKLRNGIKYAVMVLEKYETALKMEGIIERVDDNGKIND